MKDRIVTRRKTKSKKKKRSFFSHGDKRKRIFYVLIDLSAVSQGTIGLSVFMPLYSCISRLFVGRNRVTTRMLVSLTSKKQQTSIIFGDTKSWEKNIVIQNLLFSWGKWSRRPQTKNHHYSPRMTTKPYFFP